MNTPTDSIDDLLDSSPSTSVTIPVPAGTIDPRIKLMSYSSNLTLHKCPRKLELYKKKATDDPENPEAASNQNVTFAFGHVVGDAIQNILDGWSEEKVIWNLFLGWHAALDDSNDKQVKSIWWAILAAQKFISLREQGFLNDYELLSYNGKPAKELSFRIHLPNGFKFRGSVDAVLRHRTTGRILVLEVKTSSMANLNPTTFKNSSQAIGYSVVLDVIAPDANSYDVLYLVYLTKSLEYQQLRFPKTYLQRAQWIQELLLDAETIEMYERAGVYPMRGESCFDFYRDCEYLSQCSLSTELVTVPLVEDAIHDSKVYDVELSLEDLIESQMKKVIPIVVVRDNVVIPFDGDEIL